jgi:hypothetical protein
VSQADVGVLTRFYETHLSREGFLRLAEGSGHVDDEMANDVVIVPFEEALETTPYHGHDGLRAWARENLKGIDDLWFELLDARDAGDGWVFLKAHVHGQIQGIESTFVIHVVNHVENGRWDWAKGYLREEDALAGIEELRRSGVPSP